MFKLSCLTGAPDDALEVVPAYVVAFCQLALDISKIVTSAVTRMVKKLTRCAVAGLCRVVRFAVVINGSFGCAGNDIQDFVVFGHGVIFSLPMNARRRLVLFWW